MDEDGKNKIKHFLQPLFLRLAPVGCYEHANQVFYNTNEGGGTYGSLMIKSLGQISVCDNSRGTCDCLPPFVEIVETTERNWRGKNTTKLNRLYNSGGITGKDLYRIRMMQGQESIVKHALQISDGVSAYSEGDDWESIFLNFIDNPQNYWCFDRQCDVGDTTTASNLDSTSSRYNFNCGSTCPGTNETTKIPCSGKGICGASGQCVCDPAKVTIGEDQNGFKEVFQFIPGVTTTTGGMWYDGGQVRQDRLQG